MLVDELREDAASRPSFKVRALLVPVVPTEREPAIVGNWLQEQREASDCSCRELTFVMSAERKSRILTCYWILKP